MARREVELRIKEHVEMPWTERLFLVWEEKRPVAMRQDKRYKNYLVNVSPAEVTSAFKGLHSLISNIDQNLYPSKIQVTHVTTLPQEAFLSPEFAQMCKSLDIVHTVQPLQYNLHPTYQLSSSRRKSRDNSDIARGLRIARGRWKVLTDLQ